jgi:hypothetical protein
MPLKAETKIVKNQNAKTMYITIPAFLAEDSAFPFKAGSNVEVEIVTEERSVAKGMLIVRKSEPGSTSKRK